MQLALTAEKATFRDELRTFFTTEIPAEIRERSRLRLPVTRDDIVTSHKILHEHGLAVPHWPVQWGGKDWTPTQHQIYLDEMQLASVVEPLNFNTKMVGPVIAESARRRPRSGTCRPPPRSTSGGARASPSPRRAPTWRRCVPPRPATATASSSTGRRRGRRWGQYADWIFCLVRTDPHAPKRQAGISFLLIDMATPGITVRPIKLIDGGHEVNEVFFSDVRVPADQLVGEENQGWAYAKFLLGNERTGIAGVGRTKVRLAEVKQRATDTGLLADPLFAARLAEVENELLALELTQMRVASGSADGRPNPASSVLKLRGSQLQQLATELLVEVAGPDALPFDAGVGIASPVWAQRSAPHYLNYRKTSSTAAATRSSAPSSRRPFSDCESRHGFSVER
jgi:alkylation response protein AidB-like acyl-CoA dehydrogenase